MSLLNFKIPNGLVVDVAKTIPFKNTVLDNVYKNIRLVDDNHLSFIRDKEQSYVLIGTPEDSIRTSSPAMSGEVLTTKGVYLKTERALTGYFKSRINDIAKREPSILKRILNNFLPQQIRLVKTSQAAMGTQALTGKIEYPYQDGKKLTFNFGSPKKISSEYSLSSLKLNEIISVFEELSTTLTEQYGSSLSDIVFFVPDNIRGKLYKLVYESDNKQVSWQLQNDGSILFNGMFKLFPIKTEFKTAIGTTLNVHDSKTITAVDTSAGHGIYYLKVWNVFANDRAMSHFTRIYSSLDGGSEIIQFETHTITVPEIKAITVAKLK